MVGMRVESTLGCQVLVAVVCQLHVLGGTLGHLPAVQLCVHLEVTRKFGRQASSTLQPVYLPWIEEALQLHISFKLCIRCLSVHSGR